jgi:hypothetical protein
MDLTQKLREKYGRSTPPVAEAIRPVKTLQLDPAGRYTGTNFPNLNCPTAARIYACKRCHSLHGEEIAEGHHLHVQ